MRRALGAWALVLCVATTGCRTGPDGLFGFLRPSDAAATSPPTDSVARLGKAFGNTLAGDQIPGLYVEYVLYERPVGDPLLDRDLWVQGSAQLTPKARTLLEENGMRVTVLGGNLPIAFQKLLESNDGIVKPLGLTFTHRTEEVLPTVGPIEKCEYRLLRELSGEREKVKLTSANGGVLVRPEQTADGRVKLWCEPQVQHGERQDWIRPTADASGFSVMGEVPLERYPSLGFEVTLGSGEFLVIGSPADATDTLGSALFNLEGKSESLQRVLVIRAMYRGEPRSDLPALPRSRGGRAIASEVSHR